MSAHDCDLRWCDETGGETHRAYVYDAVGDVANVGRSLSLTLECGPVETDPLPVIAVNDRCGKAVCRLSWEQASRLALWLHDSRERWAS